MERFLSLLDRNSRKLDIFLTRLVRWHLGKTVFELFQHLINLLNQSTKPVMLDCVFLCFIKMIILMINPSCKYCKCWPAVFSFRFNYWQYFDRSATDTDLAHSQQVLQRAPQFLETGSVYFQIHHIFWDMVCKCAPKLSVMLVIYRLKVYCVIMFKYSHFFTMYEFSGSECYSSFRDYRINLGILSFDVVAEIPIY